MSEELLNEGQVVSNQIPEDFNWDTIGKKTNYLQCR